MSDPQYKAEDVNTAEDLVNEAQGLAESLYRDGAIRGIDPRVNTITSYITGFHAGLQWAIQRGVLNAAVLDRGLENFRGVASGMPMQDIYTDVEDDPDHHRPTTVVEWHDN